MVFALDKYKELLKRVDDIGLDVVASDLTLELAEILSDSWSEVSQEAIDESIEKMSKEKTLKGGLGILLLTLSSKLEYSLTAQQIKEVEILVDGVYASLKEVHSRNFEISTKITKLDKQIINVFSQEGPYWIGNFYNRLLSERISDIGRLVAESGISIEKGSTLMKEVLSKELALFGGGSDFPTSIPSQFSGSVDNYTKILSTNVAVRSRNFAFITTANQARIETLEFSAVMDDRTSQICQFMNGKRFSTAQGVSLVSKVATAMTPAKVKELTPWVSSKEAKKIAGTGELEEQSNNLASSGIMIPPLHGL
ncbi:MAG: hypothetical protein KAS32_19610 [Candidatus Peribacteraceae bacterium]|nr:hypothetical protein [Candidatus Peribacteraceae bacterium]